MMPGLFPSSFSLVQRLIAAGVEFGLFWRRRRDVKIA